MSKKVSAIKMFIEYFMNNKEPVSVNRYMWRYLDEQQAAVWLYHKQFVRLRHCGDSYILTRHRNFYKIFDNIKDMTPKQIYKFLVDKYKIKEL